MQSNKKWSLHSGLIWSAFSFHSIQKAIQNIFLIQCNLAREVTGYTSSRESDWRLRGVMWWSCCLIYWLSWTLQGLCSAVSVTLHYMKWAFCSPGNSGLKCLSSSAFMSAFALYLSLTYFPGEERAFAVDWLAVRNSCWFCQSTLRNGASPQ